MFNFTEPETQFDISFSFHNAVRKQARFYSCARGRTPFKLYFYVVIFSAFGIHYNQAGAGITKTQLLTSEPSEGINSTRGERKKNR